MLIQRQESMEKSILLSGFLGLLRAFPAGQAMAATVIYHCGTVIAAPGDYYLANDIPNCYPSSGPAAAINIQAEGVILNLNGHTLSGKVSFWGSGFSSLERRI
jgi:hypothetical protein